MPFAVVICLASFISHPPFLLFHGCFFLRANLHENLFILHHAEKESLELIDPEEDDEHHYDEHDEDHEDHGGHDDHDDDDADGEGGGNYTLA